MSFEFGLTFAKFDPLSFIYAIEVWGALFIVNI